MLNCWNSSMCASSTPKRSAICRERMASLRRFSSWSRSSSRRFFAISASTYLPCRSQLRRCSSRICKKSCTADSSAAVVMLAFRNDF
eukprot:scaffold1221_cov237-Pinguiococcus_pyrenoidosus.AAC.2